MSDDSNGALIKLEGVCKSFLTEEVETHALLQIDLTIAKGEYISISGPSGCGKSTLLSILGLLDSANDGEYWLNGRSVMSLTASERARIRNTEIGFIFQSFNLIGDLTVQENVELPLTFAKKKGTKDLAGADRILMPGTHGTATNVREDTAIGRAALEVILKWLSENRVKLKRPPMDEKSLCNLFFTNNRKFTFHTLKLRLQRCQFFGQ